MRRIRIFFCFMMAIVALSGALMARAVPPQQSHAGEFLVKFAPRSSAAERAATVHGLGGELGKHIPGLEVDVVRFGDGAPLRAAGTLVEALERNPNIEYAQPNYPYTTVDTGPTQVFLPQIVGVNRFIPNDADLPDQYAWANIHAYEGWAITRGSSSVVVAIVDTGIQLSHPDLNSKIVEGYDFVDGDASANDTVNGHGTHVAGIVGAETNNGLGGAGTCPNCSLMPVRVLDGSGNGYTSDVIDGIRYAVDSGARVINLSLGGPNPDPLMEQALNYAWSKGVFVACAAGNNGNVGNPINYPAYYTNCEAVGAVGSDDKRATYSEYGTWVDVAAPGSLIYSTYRNSGWSYLSGTSMATPHVAGVAGLLAGQGLTNAQIRDRIAQTADPISGTGTLWSNGRLNLLRAVRGN